MVRKTRWWAAVRSRHERVDHDLSGPTPTSCLARWLLLVAVAVAAIASAAVRVGLAGADQLQDAGADAGDRHRSER
jgi:hypothetical protein